MIKKFYSLLLLPLFLFPFFVTAQAQNADDCRIQSPVMVLRLSPIIASESGQAINHRIVTQVTRKKHLLSGAFVESEEAEVDMGPGFWIDLNYAILQEFNQSGEVSNTNSSTTYCNNEGSPLTAHLGFDVINADLGAVTFNLGAVGGVQSREFTVSSVDNTSATTSAFDNFDITSNGLIFGGYGAVYGDSFYVFASYTQHTSPIKIDAITPDGDPQVFHDDGFSSIGGGIGFVADSFVRFSTNISGHAIDSTTTASAITFDSEVTQNYQAIDLSWFVANAGVGIETDIALTDANLNINASSNTVVVANRGDDTFNALGKNDLEHLIGALARTHTADIALEDSSAYNTFGIGVEYNALNGLSLGAKGYYTLQLADGASVDSSSYGAQLQAGYGF